MKKYVYALTGNIGCGKSTVAKLMKSLFGFYVLDSDSIAKEILFSEEARPKLKKVFGSYVFEGNELDVRKMTAAFFNNPEAKKKWENWIFPRVWKKIREEIKKIVQDNPGVRILVESALVYEVGWEKKFDAVIVVKCSEEERCRRLMQDRKFSLLEIEERLAHQLPSEEKERKADYVIDTECELESLKERAKSLQAFLK